MFLSLVFIVPLFCGYVVTDTSISLPNNQSQHRTSHAPKDVLPVTTATW